MDKRGSPIRQKFQILSHATVMASSSDKLAKFHGEIAKDAQGRVDLAAEMRKHPDALWLRVRAIVADEANDNGDYFSREEVMKYYRTFEGVPVFTNHENQKVEAAKGKVVLAEWVDSENAVYCTMFVDREAHPALCRAIEEGYVTDVSMGTQVDYSTCSVCENKAFAADSYCPHVKTMKGRTVDGKKVFERNYGLKFIEVSVVTDGACQSCTIQEILDPADVAGNGEALMRAADSVAEIVRTSSPGGALLKEAGQEEIGKLNQAMDLIEQVSRKMLDERQYIDLEFLSKVVEVLADLQHVNDELVDQGYGSIGQAPQQQAMPAMPEKAGEVKEEAAGGQKPSVMGPVPTGVGTVTEPATASSDADSLVARGARIKDLHERAAKIYEEQKRLSGGDEVNKEERYDNTVKKLATVWDSPSVRGYKTEASEGDFKVVVGAEEIIGLRGGTKIAALRVADLDQEARSEIKNDPYKAANILLTNLKEKFASVRVAEKAPTDTKEQLTETFEAQLESQRPPLHPREHDVRESITEKQLESKGDNYSYHARRGEARDAVTEKQLREGKVEGHDQFKPQDSPRDETTELQLRNTKWKGNSTPAEGPFTAAGTKDQSHQIHEGQLEDWRSADKGHNPTDSITEKQLQEDIGEPWGRRIASREDARNAYAAGMKAIVRTALATGATPDEIIEAASFLSSPKVALKAIQASDVIGPDKGQKGVRADILRRANFHGINKLAVASKSDVESYLLGSVYDAGMTGEVGIEVLSEIASQKDAFSKIASAIEKGLGEEQKQPVASARDFLKEAMNEDAEAVENVKVLLAATDVEADEADKEAFAKAAFAKATKLAEAQGVRITGTVHVAKQESGMIEVEMLGVKEAKKEMPDFIKEKIEQKKDKKDKKGDEGDKKEEKDASADLEQRKEARKKMVEAQMPPGGGMPPAGGPPPGMGGGGTTMPAAPAGDPTAGVPPQGALTTPPAGEEPAEEEGSGEAQPPGTICPACGSDDMDLKGGEFNCNNCGNRGTVTVKIESEWPGTIKDKGPGEGEEGGDEGLPGLEGGGGMEMPQVGVAASFKVTPEMVKIAGNKPLGSYCPRCGSGRVELKAKSGSGDGKCLSCTSSYRVDSYVDRDDFSQLWASIKWTDAPQPKKASCALPVKKAKLELALKSGGLIGKFGSADLGGKAKIIAELHDKGLLD
jgi:ssDNA-binding Zn-finger/Zn-ribbon topoisomerase 1